MGVNRGFTVYKENGTRLVCKDNKDNSARFVTKETYHHFYLNRVQVELLVSLFFFSNTNGHIYYRDIMDLPEHSAITLRVIRTYTFFMY